ncbi:hypothetical protein [Microlunatus sp. GCM10028923]|uniref:hypothetical protein n=1 Tax=Microlunatus sp. GCM10028923 TaxID=3273400 RepID=UPI00361F87F2
MNMHRSRWQVRAVLAGLAAALVLAGCTADPGTDESGKPIVTVQVITDSRAIPMKDMPWTKDLAAACECTINWQETPASSWSTQKQASLAAGDVADVTIGGYGGGDWGDYGSLFLDLAPELTSMPNLSMVFEKVSFARVVSTWDGKIYGGPGVMLGTMADTGSHMFINKQWLDKLGLDVPTTWDELETVLEAFKTGDPNGNGEADEIPLDFNSPGTGGWGGFQPNILLGGRGISPSGGMGMYADQGTVKSYLTDPAYKEFIQYMRDLWSKGLISKEAFTHDWSQWTATAKGDGKTARMGVSWMWTPSDLFGSKLADQYITIPQLKAEAGQSEKTKWMFGGDGMNYQSNKISIAADVRNKEAALRLVDSMYTPDIGVQMRYGSFGVGVKKNSDLNYTVLDPADSSKNLSDWQFINSLGDRAPSWVTQPGVTLTIPKEFAEVRAADAVYDREIANMDLNTDLIYSGVSFTADEGRQYSLNNTGITQAAMSKFAQWVTKGGIEDEWDAYVADLERNKLAEQIKLQQQAYDRFVKVMADNKVDLNIQLTDPDLVWKDNPDGSATMSRPK